MSSSRYLIVALALTALVAGCGTLSNLLKGEPAPPPVPPAAFDGAQQKLDATKAAQEKALAEAQAAALAAKTEAETRKAQEAAAAAAKTLEYLASLQAGLDKAKALQQAATGPDGRFDLAGAAAGAGALVPPPWNLILMLGVPALVGLVQQKRVMDRDRDTRSVINAIDVLRSDPSTGTAARSLMASAKAKMDEQLTPRARKLRKEESLT